MRESGMNPHDLIKRALRAGRARLPTRGAGQGAAQHLRQDRGAASRLCQAGCTHPGFRGGTGGDAREQLSVRPRLVAAARGPARQRSPRAEYGAAAAAACGPRARYRAGLC